jgi:hypothetical protein
MVPQDKITEIFCSAGDFCLAFKSELKKYQLNDRKQKGTGLLR